MNFSQILAIPFESKKAFNPKSKAKYFFKGVDYFMIDKNGKILRDFIILKDSFTFRPNDNAMRFGGKGKFLNKGTNIWRSKIGDKSFSQVRLEVFPKSGGINLQLDSTAEMIDKINNISISYMNTSLKMEGFISGSPSSGADSRMDSAPLVCTDNKYYGVRFTNALKKMRKVSGNCKDAYEEYPITMELLASLETISLEQYLSNFPEAKIVFYKLNPESADLFEIKDLRNIDFYYDNFDDEALLEELTSYSNRAKLLYDKFIEGKIDSSKLKRMLRNLLRPQLIMELRRIKKPTITGRFEKEQNLDAAHLCEVHMIKNMELKEWYKMADINNGLLLPKDIHGKLDNDPDFKLSQDFKFYENKIPTGFKINKEYINGKRRQYLEKRNNG